MNQRNRAAIVVAAMLLVSAAAGLAAAAQSAGKTIHDGVFTEAQIERGVAVFEKTCADCHPTDVFGPAYMEGWNGASVGELIQLVQDTMPYENPGSLKPEEYVDVLTYIFSLNGVPAGETELPISTTALFEIIIDGPYEWKGDGHVVHAAALPQPCTRVEPGSSRYCALRTVLRSTPTP